MAYVPDRGIPVIVQNRDVLEAIAGLSKATGSITFAANATNAKTLTIYGSVFEFLDDISGVGAGNIAVHIGSDAEETRDNLLTAIDSLPEVQSGTATVEAAASSTNAITLTYYDVGTAGNVAMTTDDGNITVSGMAGGANGGVLTVNVQGMAFDGTIDIGDVQIKNTAGTKVNPATEDKQDDLIDTLCGSGAPTPMAFSDPGSDAYTAAIASPARTCYKLRLIVGNSGVVVSLDNGTTESIKLPPNCMDEITVSITASSNIKVKRYTSGVAMTDLVVEVW